MTQCGNSPGTAGTLPFCRGTAAGGCTRCRDLRRSTTGRSLGPGNLRGTCRLIDGNIYVSENIYHIRSIHFRTYIRMVHGMGEDKINSGAGTTSGGPDRRIVYAVIAVAVVILAAAFVAKFEFGTDLLNPAGGQMSLVQRPVTTISLLDAHSYSSASAASDKAVASQCSQGTTSCNGKCTDLQNDIRNCGACGNTCTFVNGNGTCSSGQCVIMKCFQGFGDCDRNRENGCETNLFTDWQNCGACGQKAGSVCSASYNSYGRQQYCSQGKPTDCQTWFADCDHNAGNACETNIKSDPMNCGCCKHSCPASQICTDGVCKNPS